MSGAALPFTKMHGCGNDYVVVDATRHEVAEPAALARAACDRRLGVGADGLLLALPGSELPDGGGDVRMRMLNPDGSEAEMCGNGLRCLARFAAERGLVADRASMRVETGAGVLPVRLTPSDLGPWTVTIDMGPPAIGERERTLDVDGETVRLTTLALGNPHAVLFVDDTASAPVHELGARIERHPAFPNRTNVEFVEVLAPDALRQRTWERGAGETLACGTGACAAAVAAELTGRSGREVTVHLLGGDLAVRLDAESGHVFLTGPAVEVFEGRWPLG